ncbi:MAG TPA: DUF3147 family protein [Kofleriaceae bacterium]|nr:DUF3147 family protein [Kofleriaceae bacterium]
MVGELVLRFVIGGAVVSLFAALAELFEPKTFSGLFGAAPSVALASLALTYHSDGAAKVAIESRWMVVACVAMAVYGSCCVLACRQRRVPVWLGALASWCVWAAVAFVLWISLRGVLAT